MLLVFWRRRKGRDASLLCVYIQLMLLLLCEWLYCVFALCVPLPLHDKYICFSRTIASDAAKRDFCKGELISSPMGVTSNAEETVLICVCFWATDVKKLTCCHLSVNKTKNLIFCEPIIFIFNFYATKKFSRFVFPWIMYAIAQDMVCACDYGFQAWIRQRLKR